MTLTCLFVDVSTVATDLLGLATVSLRRGFELNPAMAVVLVTPDHKRGHPLTDGLHANEWPNGILRPAFSRAE